jgi:hypothetical protein
MRKNLVTFAVFVIFGIAMLFIGISFAPTPHITDHYCDGYTAAMTHAYNIIQSQTDGSLWINPDCR